MNTQICVNCRNQKPVNQTDNRLVTESCGHVKCMGCLLEEKTGCTACLKDQNGQEGGIVEETLAEESESAGADTQDSEDNKDNQVVAYEDSSKKKKLETSHIRIETDANGRCYVCTLCKKRFHARSQVAYHAYCNGQRKPYQCPECNNKSFATHSHYKYHMRVHRNERTYKCDVCSAGFVQMSKLQRHMLKHTEEKKYVCTECNKAFNNLTSLRKHGLTHTEERPYACTTCGRRFRDGSNYKKHLEKHKEKKCSCGEWCEGGCGADGGGATRANRPPRPHQCPRCPQAFHSSKDMKRHAAVHTDSKPFRCKVCHRRFRRKDNLERHIRNTHPNYTTSSAVECDETALKEITTKVPEKPDEKTQLVNSNPLPPLSREVLEKHMSEKTTLDEIDKSYILVANNARQSVIVGKWSAKVEKAPSPSPECEYVHKIRKANSMASQKNIPLPPIDERKMIELNEKSTLTNWEVGTPPNDRKKLYEMILYGDGEKKDSEVDTSVDSSSESHWMRRKMKLNINW
ncbi:hypothetical protein K1T71_006490 [Dendrolimus kikuchii]|uniref:Uncharacterized protein n=1 Tax=Dendrolimus kikuchii TaxID=765133 RepID=A0ACC1D196_9NEOP|nr:hypothetical protein K1T71_006490 [Dendrolimus kikuchii]